jgi:4-amino-4-deoxy-L-arabinose transferase-like glycosyltransferase
MDPLDCFEVAGLQSRRKTSERTGASAPEAILGLDRNSPANDAARWPHWLSLNLSQAATRLNDLPAWVFYLLLFAFVAASHATLLTLPYFWDEGGYYIPAALDFYHHGWLVPHFTNAHPPLPNLLLGTLWHLVGYHILATRLFVCAFAAAALQAIFRLATRLLDAPAALCLTALTAVYPIWFAQSSLAHADIFAAAFTLWALALYLPAQLSDDRPRWAVAILFALAALSKETAILWPAALAAIHLTQLIRQGTTHRRSNLLWLTALSSPLLPLLAWYGYHHHVTGFTFGNPEYLRYNATANLTAAHLWQAVRYRFLHLFWQRDIWLPIVLAAASLFLPRQRTERSLTAPTLRTIALLVVANWAFFSVLGGALLTRYLLPVYPLLLLVCLDVWRTRTHWWPIFWAITVAAFLSALWINPPTSFAPEDNLTYRDMIVVHQEAIAYVAVHFPQSTVLTAWPVAADLFRPELGYATQPIKAFSIEDFSRPEIEKAAQEPGAYDTAIVFTTHYTTPSFRRWLLAHPTSRRGQEFERTRDLTPTEIAFLLGGKVVWQDDRNGEWAAVLRFPRSYNAKLSPWPATEHGCTHENTPHHNLSS